MLSYPSIPRWQDTKIGQPCLAFNKYDGSNIRVEWSPKRGWYKYGTRNHLFDATNAPYNQAIPLFQPMGEEITKIVCEHYGKTERIVAFTEFFGPSSFAGTHDMDEPKQLVLFDVSVYKKGFIPPRNFVKMFGHLPYTAKVVYDGKMNHEFVEAVRHGQYPVYEGVVCKGDGWNAKIKTHEFINRLKNRYGTEWEKYE